MKIFNRSDKLALARAFFYILLIGVAIALLPAVWEALCAATIMVLQCVAIVMILGAVITLLDSMITWCFSKGDGNEKVWKFA